MLRRLPSALVVLAVCVGFCQRSEAQGRNSLRRGSTVATEAVDIIVPDAAVPRDILESSPDAAASSTPAAEAAASPRLQQLMQLTYDRRPSAILKALAAEQAPASTVTAPQVDGDPATTPEGDSAGATASDAASPADVTSEEVDSVQPATDVTEGAPSTAPSPAEAAALAEELATLQRNVTLGRWAEVRDYLAGLPEDERKAGYAQMLQSFSSAPQPDPSVPRPRNSNAVLEQHVFELDDVIGLADACPHELDRSTLTRLSPVLRIALQAGVLVPTIVARLEQEAERPDDEAVLTRIQCAWLLLAAGLTTEVEPFLPTLEQAVADGDAESLIPLSQSHIARYETAGKLEHLQTAWEILQAVLGMEGVAEEQHGQAMQMTLQLVPKVDEDRGMAWLRTAFADDPHAGMQIITSTGTSAASALQSRPHDPNSRLAELRVQKVVVETLFEADPARADEWRDALGLLALNWLREAELSRTMSTSSNMGPRLQRDMYGNLFYVTDEMAMEMQMSRQSGDVRPIGAGEVLEVAPPQPWLDQLDAEMLPKFMAVHAQLCLKVSDEERAYPYIEQLAPTHPDLARDLVHEFIRTWTRNHDPNANSRYTNAYMFMYGFERRANSIPLTRSKQERNLEELAGWVQRIQQLPIEDIDQTLIAKAFTTCHSSAEVYRLEAIEEVFGSQDALESGTLAELVQQMRANLLGLWRMPAQQEAAKTQRKQKDIEAEVLRGYEVARAVVENGMEQDPDNWRLQLADACLLMDENSYQNELNPSSEFSATRLDAMQRFQRAAELYAAAVPGMAETDQTSTVYEHWFYAGLGASDLQQIDHRSLPDPRQPALIRDAMLALPGEAAQRHIELFANSLFVRMSALKPNVKFQYLDAGFTIVGDAPQAREARKVYDYYQDLVTEIRLVTRIDGSADVGHDAPFGVFVDLNHTREIERESGGFGKYLQNQNNTAYAYNYGRPLENYRDKFEEAARLALEEHFEVLSVTFQETEVHSRAAEEYGWRVTPYAYLLLKARGPQVDKLPSLKIDLDFLDTSGFVVLPVTSSPLSLDASSERPAPRPYENLVISQTLDERQAAGGKLILEVRASARGLVPPLEELFDVRTSDFEVTDTEDQGVLISRFDPESRDAAIQSERTWMITYAGRKDLAALPTMFHFPEPKVDVAENAYLRYQDADLVSVEPIVSLEQTYGEVRSVWPWIVAAALLTLIAGFAALRFRKKRESETAADLPQLPESLTPFNVLALLRQVEARNGFDAVQQRELALSIESLERHYFSAHNGESPPDLKAAAERWLRPSSSRAAADA